MFCFRTACNLWLRLMQGNDATVKQLFWIVLSDRGQELCHVLKTNQSMRTLWQEYAVTRKKGS